MHTETDCVPSTLTEALDVLAGLYSLPEPRREKCATYWRLARQVGVGTIVELGTYHGNGAIALALGAVPGALVYTVDDYAERRGWANEPYGPADLEIFRQKISAAGVLDRVRLVQEDVLKVASWWNLPIDLLVWDLGMPDRLRGDLAAWLPHVRGLVAIHDTAHQRLGTAGLRGYTKHPGGVWVREMAT